MFFKSCKYFLVKSFVPTIAEVNRVNIGPKHFYFSCDSGFPCFSPDPWLCTFAFLGSVEGSLPLSRPLWKGVVFAAVVEMDRRTGLFPKQIDFATAWPVPELRKRREGIAQLPLCSHFYCMHFYLVFTFYLRLKLILYHYLSTSLSHRHTHSVFWQV